MILFLHPSHCYIIQHYNWIAGEKFWKLIWKGYFTDFIFVWSYVYMIDWPLLIDYGIEKKKRTKLMLITNNQSVTIFIYLKSRHPTGSSKPHLSWQQVFLILLPQFGIFPHNCETEVWSEGNRKEFNEN